MPKRPSSRPAPSGFANDDSAGTKPTSLRLPLSVHAELTRRAEDAGQGISVYLRSIVMEALAAVDPPTATPADELKPDLEKIIADLRKLRGDLATSTRMLLVTAGKQDQAAATNWVREHLLS